MADRLEELRDAIGGDWPPTAELTAWAVDRIEALEGEIKAAGQKAEQTIARAVTGDGLEGRYASVPEMLADIQRKRIAELESALASAERREGEAVALLRGVQWGHNGCCPYCSSRGILGHFSHCRLAAALRKGEGKRTDPKYAIGDIVYFRAGERVAKVATQHWCNDFGWQYQLEGNPLRCGERTLYPVPKALLEAAAERDRLRAVVSELMASAEYWSEYDVPLGIMDRMRAALGT